MEKAENDQISDERRKWGLRNAITVLGVLYSLYHIFIVMNLLEYFDTNINAITHRAISLYLTLILVFLLLPFSKKSARAGGAWWDWILIIGGGISCGFIALFFQLGWADPSIYPLSGEFRKIVEVCLSAIIIVLVLEATRRVIGWALPLVAIFLLIYTIFSNYFPGYFQGRGYSLARVASHIYMWSEGIWGLPMGVAATTIVIFFIFSAFLTETGAGDFFTEMAMSLFGTKRGGSAKAVIISDIFFGMISGSTSASVVTTGVFTIPMMKKAGYSPNFAGAVEAVSSNGAQITPPVMGAVAFVMCEMLDMPYRTVVISALIPAIFYWAILYITLDVNAAAKGIRGLSRSEVPPVISTAASGWFFLVPVVAIIVFIVWLKYTPEMSALYGVCVLFVVTFFVKRARMGWSKIIKALEGAARGMMLVTTACATAGIILGCISLTGVGAKFATLVISAALGNTFLVLAFAAFGCFILGMGMSSIPVYLTVAITISPILVEAQIEPFVGHLFLFWWALASFITPPVAIAAFAAAGISGGDPMKTGFEGMRLGAGLYILPFFFVYRPALLLFGRWDEVLAASVFCLIGCVGLIGSLNGFLLTKVRAWERILLGLGCAMVVKPGWTANLGLVFMAAGMLNQIVTKAIPLLRFRTEGDR